MTPSDIEVLLHCYYSPTPHPRRQAPAIAESLNSFLDLGAIQPSTRPGTPDGTFSTTPLGSAWVKALCAVPPPKRVFLDEQGRIIT